MNILFPIILGSEVRQFYHSGIIKHLMNNHNLFIYTDSPDIIKIAMKNDIDKIIFATGFNHNLKGGTILSYIKFILDEYYKITNRTWKYKPDRNISKIKSIIIKVLLFFLTIKIVRFFVETFEERLKKRYQDRNWKLFLIENKIDKIVLNVPDISVNLCLTANNLKIPIIVAYHTNKDVFTKSRFFCKFEKFGVWNKKMKDELIMRYKIRKSQVKIIGCAHFEYLNRIENLIEKSEFEKIFNCNLNNPLILYTTAAPWIIENEEQIIFKIVEILQKQFSDFKLIVRVNPMDNVNNWKKIKNKYIEINYSEWYWDNQRNINIANTLDLAIFNSLIKYSNICINIPSSVTIEANLQNLPIINIGFLPSNVNLKNNKILDFWNAPFYNEVIIHKSAFLAKSTKELEELIDLTLKSKVKEKNDKYLKSVLGPNYKTLFDNTFNFIQSV